MSFTMDVKNELFAIEEKTENVFLAHSYGTLIFTRLFALFEGVITTESKSYAQYIAQLIGRLGALSQIEYKLRRTGAVYNVSIQSDNERKHILSLFSHTGEELNLRVNKELIKSEAERRAFLRGAFISCGVVSDPNKEYHLELSCSQYLLSKDLIEIMSLSADSDFEPMHTIRNGKNIIYLKDSEKITDFLVCIGATQSSMELMQAKMLKEVRNYVNRTNNFETANIGKTVKASVEHSRAIEKIISIHGIDHFPPQLREVAKLRLDNPDMSLRELSEILGLSRSGVNHRLRKIMEMAKDI